MTTNSVRALTDLSRPEVLHRLLHATEPQPAVEDLLALSVLLLSRVGVACQRIEQVARAEARISFKHPVAA